MVDNLPLVTVFGNSKPITDNVSPRIVRWKCKLNNYDYDIEFVKGKNNVADWLSRSGVDSPAETKTEAVHEIERVIMQIEDEAERREAIAKAINDGIRSGEIDVQKAFENPDFRDWLNKHNEITEMELNLGATKAPKNQPIDNEFSTTPSTQLAPGLDSLFS